LFNEGPAQHGPRIFNQLLKRLERGHGPRRQQLALDRFAHRAVWNSTESRVEMHLLSLAAQDVRITRAELLFHLHEGETIWTESSYKYPPADIASLVQGAGFALREQWIDDQDGFALTLYEAN